MMVFLREPELRRGGCVLLGATTAILGVISILTGDFAYTWQPVPEALPARALAARITGVVLVVVSAFFVMPGTQRRGLAAITSVFAAWLVVLHVPKLLTGENWLGFFEFLLPLGACLALLGVSERGLTNAGASKFMSADRLFLIGRMCFGVGLIGCGVSHFVYAEFAARLIPDWIPTRLFFTYLTGAGHVAAGLSLLAGVWMRISTALLCFMLACFVVLLHVPRVLANPNRYEWTMLIVATLFNGAAWLIAAAVRVPEGRITPLESTAPSSSAAWARRSAP